MQVANNQWCREPPTYSARKPPLLEAALPNGWKGAPPKLTHEFVRKHASPKNFVIATYINFKRLDFAMTMVKHLIALGQPHYIVGAMDMPALEGLLAHGIPAFYIDSGLTTEDYGWGTPNFRKMGLHKVQLVLDLAKLGVDALTVCRCRRPPHTQRRICILHDVHAPNAHQLRSAHCTALCVYAIAQVDADAFILREPWQFIKRYPKAGK